MQSQSLTAPHTTEFCAGCCPSVYPAGVPHALRFMPGLLDAVKGAVAREAAQLFDKLAYVANKVGILQSGCCFFHCWEGEAAMQAGARCAGWV